MMHVFQSVARLVVGLFQRVLQVLALGLILVWLLVAMVWWALTTPLRLLLLKPYRSLSYYFHPLGGDHYETWNPFSNNY